MASDKSFLYRYPGTKPFEATENALFRGRDEDIRNLYELISLQSLVVLFGRSGLGKSSLLNAGLVNSFKNDKGIVPMFLRFGAFYDKNTITPLEKLHELISSQQQTNSSNFIFEKLISKEEITLHHLWYVFKSFQIANPDKETFILIFDQFEELFTYPEKKIELFKKELSELFYVSVPQQLRNLLKDKLLLDANYLTKAEKDILFRPLNIKILFSIRSDKMSLLNSLTDYFPSVLKSCYELKPLNKQQARQAIEEPAKLQDKKYASPPFTFTEEAIAVLLNELTTAKYNKEGRSIDLKQEIETFQLQIVCKHAENLVIEKRLKQITASDLGNIKEIFENHYRNIIAKLPPDKQLPARRLIEEKLIIDGTRVSMPIPFILRDEGMTKELLDELINTHILRREQNNTVEISHDTLIEPILKYYEERKKQEAIIFELREKEEQIQRIKEEREKLIKEQQQAAEMQRLKAKRNRLLVTIISIALILTIGLASYALNKSRLANQQKVLVTVQKNRADSIALIAMTERDNANRNARIAIKEKERADSNAKEAIAALQEATSQRKRADVNALDAMKKEQLARDAFLKAEAQKEIVTKSSEAFRLITLARQKGEEDPTIALRIAEAAMQKKSDTIIEKEAKKIYEEHAFYKTLLNIFDSEISPDGKRILSYGWVRAWDSAGVALLSTDGTLIKAFKTNAPIIKPGIVSPDGTKVLIAGSDSTARLWDLNGKLLREFKNKSSRIVSLCFSPDGKKILAGSYDSTVYLWNIDGSLLNTLIIPTDINSVVAFSPDGTKILTGSTWSIPRLYDINGKLLKAFENNRSYFCGAFSPDGTQILTGNLDSTAKLWSIDGTLLRTFKGPGTDIRSVAFSPDGTRILTGFEQGTASLWSIDGKMLKMFKGHISAVRSVVFSPDGTKVITNDGTIRVWNIEGVPIKEFKANGEFIESITFSADRTKILINNNNTVWLFNTDGKLLKEYKGNNGDFTSVTFSPDGNKILSASYDGEIRLRDLEGNIIKEFKAPANQTFLAFSPDGTKILTGSTAIYSHELTLWKTDGTMLKNFEDHSNSLYSVTFSPDGTRILTTGGNRHTFSHPVKLWDLNGKLVTEFKGQDSYIYSAAFSRDGSKILTGSGKGTVTIWSIDGTPRYNFQGHADDVISVALSPDGKRILTGSSDGNAKLWSMDGKLLYAYKGYRRYDTYVAFSPDGKKFFTGSLDGSVRVWNTILPLDEFLQSDRVDKLMEYQKEEFKIN